MKLNKHGPCRKKQDYQYTYMEPALPSTYRSVKDTHPWHQGVLEFLDIVLEIQIKDMTDESYCNSKTNEGNHMP